MAIVLTLLVTALSFAFILRLWLMDISKKWTLICLLTLSSGLRWMGFIDAPVSADQFLWFTYDVGMIFWLWHIIKKMTSPETL